MSFKKHQHSQPFHSQEKNNASLPQNISNMAILPDNFVMLPSQNNHNENNKSTKNDTPSPQLQHSPDKKKFSLDPSFEWVITSDPQYPRTKETGADGSRELSERQIREQYAAINVYRDSNLWGRDNVPVMLNGDITEYSHGYQREKMKTLLSLLGPSLYFGLGNHDYENLDCLNNGCARDAMEDLRKHVENKETVSFDLNVRQENFTFMEYWNGSGAYSFISGDFMFIQLNNHPSYTDRFRSNTGLWRRDIKITKSLDSWLESQLRTARTRRKHIIINMHRSPSDSNYPTADIEKFKNLVNEYNVKAIFFGHTHKAGKEKNFGNALVFNSGAAFYKTFLVAEYDQRTGRVNVKQATDNIIASDILGSFQVRDPVVYPSVDVGYADRPTELNIIVAQTSHYYLRWKYAEIKFANRAAVRVDFTSNDGFEPGHSFKELTPNTRYTVDITAFTEDGRSAKRTLTARTTDYWSMPENFCTSFASGGWENNGWVARWKRPVDSNWIGTPMFELGVYTEEGAEVHSIIVTPQYSAAIPLRIYEAYKGQGLALGVRFVSITDPGDRGLLHLFGLDYLPLADWCSLQSKD